MEIFNYLNSDHPANWNIKRLIFWQTNWKMAFFTRFFAVVVLLISVGWYVYVPYSPIQVAKFLRTSFEAIQELRTIPQDHIEDFFNAYNYLEKMDTGITTPEEKKAVHDYYRVLHRILAVGVVMEIMLVPPVIDRKKSALINLDLWMERMMDKLQVKPGMKLLDTGCGRGLIAKNFVDWRNASVVGINIDETQVEFGNKLAKEYKGDKLKFITRDYNLPFDFLEPNSMDGHYCAQACMFVDNKTEFMRNSARVLKKGARFYGLEYVYLLPGEGIDPKSPGYDPKNQTLKQLVQHASTILGTSMPGPIQAWKEGFEKNGFKIIYAGHPTPINSVVLLQDINDTYEPLQHIISFLGRYNLISERMVKLFERLRMYWDSLLKMMQMELATPTYEFIAEKM